MSIPTINPFQFKSIIAEYLQKSLGDEITVATRAPDVKVNKPTVVVKLIRRTAKDRATGAKYSHTNPTDHPDRISRILRVIYETLIELQVYANNSSEAEKWAWLTELAMYQIANQLQTVYTGITNAFQSEEEDQSLYKSTGELEIVRFRWLFHLPVDLNIDTSKVVGIFVNMLTGASLYVDQQFTRTNLSELFEIPTTGGKICTSIRLVVLRINGEKKFLLEGTDYSVVKDGKTAFKKHIKWLTNGLSPSVGDHFWVDYELSNAILSSTRLQPIGEP